MEKIFVNAEKNRMCVYGEKITVYRIRNECFIYS